MILKFLLFSGTVFTCLNSFGAAQEIKFQKGSLSINGVFPFSPSKALTVNGYDESGTPYKLVVVPKIRSKNIYQNSYQLTYRGETSKGHVIIEVGKQGSLRSKLEGQEKPESEFSILISK